MRREIIADINPHEARVALIEEGELAEIHVEMRGNERLVGNIYKGRVENILPGMQAAFVDVGLERNAFLYAGDIIRDKDEFEVTPEGEPVQVRIPNIREILKKGEELLVQVLKQQGGTKGARITTHITLPGRYCVLMPTVEHVGISRRILDEGERERLKLLVEDIKPKGMGIIVRTVAESASEEEMRHEISFLARLWTKIKNKSDILTAPRLIHSEESLIFRTVRDMFTHEVERFVINDKEYYEKVCAVANIVSPGIENRVKLYEENDNIFDAFAIEGKIEKAMQRKVWLKSGSYLVIDETEALTVIDVNTGKYIGENDLQQTLLNTNVEAAKEIARQLRLRDIGGIVIIDFIDMEYEENREAVLHALEEALKSDRTKTSVLGITELGLVELTRKKVRRRLSGVLGIPCAHCSGSGIVYSSQTMAMKVRREAVRAARRMDMNSFLVEVAPGVANFILKKNNAGENILPKQPGKTFYLRQNKYAHQHDIVVTAIDKNKNAGIGDCVVFT